MINLMQGDCLEVMENIPDGSVDMVLTDPPYGTTACKWDSVILFEPMWEQIWRITKKNKSVILFGQEPFSSFLRASSVKEFKYDWYWKKTRPSGFVNAKLKPLKDIEVISVFSKGKTANGSENNMPYYPQGVGDGVEWSRPRRYFDGETGVNPSRSSHKLVRKTDGSNYPRQIIEMSNPNKNNAHPTQKPVALMEYLINTYTKENETVLDFTMGSGTTGIAAKNLNRSFIGIELDKDYYNIAKERIENANPLGEFYND